MVCVIREEYNYCTTFPRMSQCMCSSLVSADIPDDDYTPSGSGTTPDLLPSGKHRIIL